MGRYTPEQRRNINEAIRLTRRDRPKVRKSLFEAMAVEANFRHIPYGHSSSKGVLQQRPDMGWGPYIPGVKGVRQDIGDYLSRARRLMRQGFSGTPGQLAQAVQRSAFPERYDQRSGEVNSILKGSMSFYGGSAGATMQASQPMEYKSQPSPRKAASNFMLEQLMTARESGDPQPLNNAAMLSQMIQSTSPPTTEHEPTPDSMSETTAPVGRGAQAPKLGGSGRGIHELFYDPEGAIDEGTNIKPIGGHGSHVHISLANEAAQRRALNRARRMGLHVGESTDAEVSGTDHTGGSWHYKKYRKGSNLRMAADVSGDARKMAAYYRWVERRYR